MGGAADGPGSIVVLPDDDHDGRADSVLTFAGPFPRNGLTSCQTLEVDPDNLACVHGLLFKGDYLYFTRGDEVRRFPYAKGRGPRSRARASELVAPLGGAGVPDMRWTHNLEQHPSGSIYVSRGRFDSSVCSPVEQKKGAVLAVHAESKAALPLQPEMVADGSRNPMYLRCAPNSCGDCYASEPVVRTGAPRTSCLRPMAACSSPMTRRERSSGSRRARSPLPRGEREGPRLHAAYPARSCSLLLSRT